MGSRESGIQAANQYSPGADVTRRAALSPPPARLCPSSPKTRGAIAGRLVGPSESSPRAWLRSSGRIGDSRGGASGLLATRGVADPLANIQPPRSVTSARSTRTYVTSYLPMRAQTETRAPNFKYLTNLATNVPSAPVIETSLVTWKFSLHPGDLGFGLRPDYRLCFHRVLGIGNASLPRISPIDSRLLHGC
jgi:hypothetical protein